ncbi:MAG: hypothetical protein KJ971_01130 [Firmicutes bacterium]|nr:hypothetical protein [Bacillota bacterium]
MNKILVCIEDGLLSIRINRLLTDKRISFDLVKHPIKKEDLMRYSTLVVHSSYRLIGLHPFIENLLILNVIPIIYISMNSGSGNFHKFMNHPNFMQIEELKMDIELPLVLSLFSKRLNETEKLIQENKKLSSQLLTEKIMSKCKKYLMSLGLSENESHQKIIQIAMNNQISKYDACGFILKEKKIKDID